MSDELEQLRRAYRDIEAPGHLATRIHATVKESQRRTIRWMPLSATAAAVVAAVWLAPMLMQQAAVDSKPPAKPSLSALASLRPTKPMAGGPSLSQIRSVSVPAMPRKPKLELTKPQSNHQPDNQFLEEKDHAHS